jgi:putative two-component system response regulator
MGGQSARILLVDDDRAQLDALASILDHAGYANVVSTTDSSEVLGLCAETSPDLVMLDLDMPQPDGFAVMEMLKPWIEGRSFPVVALADNGSSEVRRRAVAAGAQELVSKPPDPETVLLRIRNMLELRFLRRELRRHTLLLEQEVETRALDDRKARLEILQRLAVAAEFRDDESGEHGERVGRTSALIGQGLGFPQDQVEMLRFAAPLHDIGKLAVPDAVLRKRAELTSEEFELVKRHVTIGRMLLGGTDLPILRMAEQIAVYHHEWWDGTGYAERLAGEKIPLVARIVAVADAFDALTHERPFKGALAPKEALEEIRRLAGRQFDPTVVRAFERLDHESLL